MRQGLSIELATMLYALTYIPYVVLTRMMATTDDAQLGRPLTGLEILPGMLIVAAFLTVLFFFLSGWARDVQRVQIGGFALPFATRWTFWSGIFTALILVTVPLSYTFTNVSIPFMQLLMRGDVLIIAPLG